MSENKILVAFEIGSSKIKGAVAKTTPDGITILTIHQQPLPEDAVRYGAVRKVQVVRDAIAEITKTLEQDPVLYPGKICGAYVSLGGFSLMSKQTSIEQTFQEETEITPEIINDIKTRAQAAGVPDRDIIAVMQNWFMVDSLRQKNPIGIYAHDIKATLTVIYCRPQVKGNLNKIFSEKIPLAINGTIPRPLAQANLILTDDERQLGCMLVDFGAETTTVSIYKDGSLRYLATIPIGSRNITLDLTALKCTERRAEELKTTIADVDPDRPVENASDESLNTSEINKLVLARIDEIISNLTEQIGYASMQPGDLPAGIIAVGGGSKLKGLITRLARQSGMKVRLGIIPMGDIKFATSIKNPADQIDIASILSIANKMGPKICVEYPEVDDAIYVGDGGDDPKAGAGNGDDPHKKTDSVKTDTSGGKGKERPRRNFWDKILNKTMDILSEDEKFDDTSDNN